MKHQKLSFSQRARDSSQARRGMTKCSTDVSIKSSFNFKVQCRSVYQLPTGHMVWVCVNTLWLVLVVLMTGHEVNQKFNDSGWLLLSLFKWSSTEVDSFWLNTRSNTCLILTCLALPDGLKVWIIVGAGCSWKPTSSVHFTCVAKHIQSQMCTSMKMYLKRAHTWPLQLFYILVYNLTSLLTVRKKKKKTLCFLLFDTKLCHVFSDSERDNERLSFLFLVGCIRWRLSVPRVWQRDQSSGQAWRIDMCGDLFTKMLQEWDFYTASWWAWAGLSLNNFFYLALCDNSAVVDTEAGQ